MAASFAPIPLSRVSLVLGLGDCNWVPGEGARGAGPCIQFVLHDREPLPKWGVAAEVGDPFAGPVEADEAYIGGKRKNMPKSRREAMKGAGSLAGKTIVAGARDRRTNKVSAAVVEGMDGWTLQSFVEDRVIADAKVYTDEHASWLGLIFHDHESVNHSKGEYVRGDAGTQGIESFWAMLKRAHTGTFHKISPKHMDRYVTEFAGRHNDRQADTLDRMGNIVRGMIGRRISYADLTAS